MQRRNVLLSMTLAAAAAMPAFGQAVVGRAVAQKAASIPDFSGIWGGTR
jgi:hypothetical protein